LAGKQAAYYFWQGAGVCKERDTTRHENARDAYLKAFDVTLFFEVLVICLPEFITIIGDT